MPNFWELLTQRLDSLRELTESTFGSARVEEGNFTPSKKSFKVLFELQRCTYPKVLKELLAVSISFIRYENSQFQSYLHYFNGLNRYLFFPDTIQPRLYATYVDFFSVQNQVGYQ